jgi:hypothetical protein
MSLACCRCGKQPTCDSKVTNYELYVQNTLQKYLAGDCVKLIQDYLSILNMFTHFCHAFSRLRISTHWALNKPSEEYLVWDYHRDISPRIVFRTNGQRYSFWPCMLTRLLIGACTIEHSFWYQFPISIRDWIQACLLEPFHGNEVIYKSEGCWSMSSLGPKGKQGASGACPMRSWETAGTLHVLHTVLSRHIQRKRMLRCSKK